jgi:two-component system, chemotaxis family, protein-glutamate methylesterase/glutaminase
MEYEAIVVGVSAGGLNAMKIMFSLLPGNFEVPIIIVQHVSPRSDGQWIELLNEKSKLRIKEADEKEKIKKGFIYVAPANYHLLIEKDKTFSLTIDERVSYARPSIDVLFETAADAYKEKLIGIILTGSNDDGTKGIKKIKEFGGMTIVQDPKTAEYSVMPAAAIAAIKPDYVLPLEEIIDLLRKIEQTQKIIL